MGNSSKKTTQKTTYGKTTTSNPYVVSKTNNKGTTSNFVEGSALDTVNNFVNQNIDSVLNDYINPSLDSVTNKAKLNNYVSALSNNSRASLENDIINPLSNRNMIRSSQATNMYKNLSNNVNSNISKYANELLSNSRSESASMLSNLLSAYMNGFNAVNSNQATSLATSKGNAKVESVSNPQDITQYLSAIAKNVSQYL